MFCSRSLNIAKSQKRITRNALRVRRSIRGSAQVASMSSRIAKSHILTGFALARTMRETVEQKFDHEADCPITLRAFIESLCGSDQVAKDTIAKFYTPIILNYIESARLRLQSVKMLSPRARHEVFKGLRLNVRGVVAEIIGFVQVRQSMLQEARDRYWGTGHVELISGRAIVSGERMVRFHEIGDLYMGIFHNSGLFLEIGEFEVKDCKEHPRFVRQFRRRDEGYWRRSPGFIYRNRRWQRLPLHSRTKFVLRSKGAEKEVENITVKRLVMSRPEITELVEKVLQEAFPRHNLHPLRQ